MRLELDLRRLIDDLLGSPFTFAFVGVSKQVDHAKHREFVAAVELLRNEGKIVNGLRPMASLVWDFLLKPLLFCATMTEPIRYEALEITQAVLDDFKVQGLLPHEVPVYERAIARVRAGEQLNVWHKAFTYEFSAANEEQR